MLDDRKTAILRAVVEEYIATAQPVGSSHIAASDGVQVSSATVRNDMAFLEQEGYLAQPHTSAGRIPTDKGYRFFVDHLTPNGKLGVADQMKVGEFFDTATGRLEETLQRTSTLLAQMTNYAAVVLGPKKEVAVVRSVQLVGLSAHLATAVVVLSNGAVESEPIELATTISEDEMQRATAHLSRLMVGKALGDMAHTAATGVENAAAGSFGFNISNVKEVPFLDLYPEAAKFESKTMVKPIVITKNSTDMPSAKIKDTTPLVIEVQNTAIYSLGASSDKGWFGYIPPNTLYYVSNMLRASLGLEPKQPTFDFSVIQEFGGPAMDKVGN